MRQGYLLSLLLFIVLEFLARQETKGIQIKKGEIKLSLFAANMILYLNYPKNSTKKLLDITFSKVAGYKTIYKKSH
jgi:hypothetical protein